MGAPVLLGATSRSLRLQPMSWSRASASLLDERAVALLLLRLLATALLLVEQAARRDQELHAHGRAVLVHLEHLAAAPAEDLDRLALVLLEHVDDADLHGLEPLARGARLLDDLGAADLELVALAAHLLDED